MKAKKMDVIKVLSAGHWIRVLDGRYQFGFVDVDDAMRLVEDGTAELFSNQGVDMIRLKEKLDKVQA